jgi:hypothetical protein
MPASKRTVPPNCLRECFRCKNGVGHQQVLPVVGPTNGAHIPGMDGQPQFYAGTVRIAKLRLLVALGRFPMQSPFKLPRNLRSFEVAGQNFTIR